MATWNKRVLKMLLNYAPCYLGQASQTVHSNPRTYLGTSRNPRTTCSPILEFLVKSRNPCTTSQTIHSSPRTTCIWGWGWSLCLPFDNFFDYRLKARLANHMCRPHMIGESVLPPLISRTTLMEIQTSPTICADHI